MPSERQKGHSSRLEHVKLPEFGQDTLQGLKQKIQMNLKQAEKPISKITSDKPKRTSKIKDIKAKNESARGLIKVADLPRKASTNGTPSVTKQKAATAPPRKQGQKRLRNGMVKGQVPGYKGQSDVNSTQLGQRQPQLSAASDLEVRAEVMALGGDAEDYELVLNMQSESEMEVDEPTSEQNADDRLAADLNSFVRGLRIDKAAHELVVETSDAGEDAEEDVRGDSVPQIKESVVSKVEKPATSIVPLNKPRHGNTSQLIFQPLSEWHAAESFSVTAPSQSQQALSLELTDRLHGHAKTLLEKENQAYAEMQRSASSSHQFYSTIMSSGTLSDKIGALTLSVQESPLHNIKALESLIGLARKRSRAQAVEVLGALKDLFGSGNLLPSNRKLRTFASQPMLLVAFSATDQKWTAAEPLPRSLSQKLLMLFAYEDWLKAAFFQILKIVETWCNDEIVFARAKAVDYVYSLLKDKPEQEANLLRLLINKLGDSDKKISSKTSFNILQLENAHPSMKPIIIASIESDLLFRPGQSSHAKYYATITLNQTVLSSREEIVAKSLLNIYFALFLELLEKPDKRELAPTGANAIKTVTVNRKGEVQGGGGAEGKKAQKKKAEKDKSTTTDEDLREKMLSAVLTGVNRAIPFINTSDESFEKHLDTLFRVTHSSNLNTSIQALMLIQQLQGSNQASMDRFYRTLYESLLDPRLLTSSKLVLYLNLVYRALRSDLNIKRVKAFAKRLLQVAALHQPSFTCGVIYLLRELEAVFPSLQSFIDQVEEDPTDDQEAFHDVEENHSEVSTSSPMPTKMVEKGEGYDGRKRDPMHANASVSALWDIQPLLLHFHPSVSLFATRLLAHAPMPPKPDLGLNTLIHFLDRFVYRNPKTSATRSTTKGVSIMQPLAGGDKGSVLVSATSAKASRERPVNSETFWRQQSEKVSADEVFFHRYFSSLGKDKEKRAEKRAKKEAKSREEDESEGDSEGDENEIWKALVDSKPEIDGNEGDEEGFSDIESLQIDDIDGSEGLKGENFETDETSQSETGNMDVDEDIPELGDSENDALLGSDDEVPSDPADALGPESHARKKSKLEMAAAVNKKERGSKKRRFKNLPTFAYVEDYEKMLGGEEEEGIA